MKKLNLNAIRIDGGTQPRERIDMVVVGDYAEAVNVGIEFPPVVVFHDGAEHWLADGFHRYHAHKQAEKASILADVRAGTRRDAWLYALGANFDHGLRLTNEDKRRIVGQMLDDEECAKWSQERIAKHCHVSPGFVSKLVAERRASLHGEEMKPSVRTVERAGKTYQQDTSNIGKAAHEAAAVARGKPAKTTLPPAPAPERGQTLPPPAEAPAPSDDFDPVAELERAHAEIQKLTAEIQAAEADDLKKEAIKWRRAYEHAERQQSEAMDRAKQATDREAWTMKQLRRCGKAVGVDDPKKIAAAVEAMASERAAA